MTNVTHRRARVLVADALVSEGLDLLKAHFDVDVRTGMTPEELVEMIPDYEAVVVRSATVITAEAIAAAQRLRVIARAGAGLDTIAVAAAVERGIEVINAPDANTLAVAELTIGLILDLARNITSGDVALKAGRWDKSRFMGLGLTGKTLGIVGFGRIGQAVAHRAQAFGMRVVTNQHRPTPELYLGAGVEPLDLYDLLAQSDFVTIHVPARPDTEHLIGVRELATMRPSAFLINTARGSVVDEAALLAALDDGTIAGAALDVFSREPATDNPLAVHPRVLATPHLGASTRDAQTSAALSVAERLVDILVTVPVHSILPLRFVPLEQVVPHEDTDQRRVERLAAAITDTGVIRNPPVVAPVGDRYVVLDGATRTEALRSLGCVHAVVQDVAVDDALGLETWHHVIHDLEPASLVDAIRQVEGLILEPSPPEEAHARVIEYGGLCAVLEIDGSAAHVVHPRTGENRLELLGDLARAYISRAAVSRTIERDLRSVAAAYPDATALIEYPQFTVEQVLLAAGSGRLLPAGVTRFVIPGRVLRLDIPLDVLVDDEQEIAEKNRWLHDHLAEKERRGSIRYYREPVYLLDE